jgi:hypothetical protein
MIRAALLAALLLACTVRPAAADAGWFESGDTVLRNDLLDGHATRVGRAPGDCQH